MRRLATGRIAPLALLAAVVGCASPPSGATNPAPVDGVRGRTGSASDGAPAINALPPTRAATIPAEPARTSLPPIPGVRSPSAPPVDYLNAKSQVEATIKGEPKSYELRIDASRFYMQAGDHLSAIPHLEAAAKLSPRKVLPWIAMGDAYTLTGQFSRAMPAYKRAEAIQPGNPLVARGEGQLLILQKRFAEARTLLENDLRHHPDDTETRTALGNLYLVLNKPRLVIETIRPALARSPDRPDLHLLIGEAYERDLHIEAAIAEMRSAVELDPRMTEAWGRLGLYLINLTRYKEARAPLEKACALEPGEAHYYWALGDSYLLDGTTAANFDQAAQLYRKALSLDPSNQKALYSFAMALTRRGRKEDLEEAVTLLQRLIRLDPIDTNAEYKLAETYRRMGRPADAKVHQARFDELFNKGRNQTRHLYAITAFRDTAGAHLKLGRDAMKAGDYELAAREFAMATEREPKSAEAGTALKAARQKLGAATTKGTP